MKELVVATKNKKKLKEIKQILNIPRLKIASLVDYPNSPYVKEDGKSFKENAIKKALKIASFTKKLTLGEDSGLCVNALGDKPGIYSARFAGKNKRDLANNLKLLRLLKNLPFSKRKAKYHCAVALADKNGLIAVKEGICSGYIGFKMQGHFGFGYDPLFIPYLKKKTGLNIPKDKKTFAQLGPKIKHRISHRYQALKKIKPILITCLKESP